MVADVPLLFLSSHFDWPIIMEVRKVMCLTKEPEEDSTRNLHTRVTAPFNINTAHLLFLLLFFPQHDKLGYSLFNTISFNLAGSFTLACSPAF